MRRSERRRVPRVGQSPDRELSRQICGAAPASRHALLLQTVNRHFIRMVLKLPALIGITLLAGAAISTAKVVINIGAGNLSDSAVVPLQAGTLLQLVNLG